MNKTLRKSQQMKKLSKKDPLHRIKSFSKFNFYEAPGKGFLPTIMPEKLLSQVNVINHIPPSKESILSWTKNILEGTAQSTS
jgi:hypothetical protein